MHTTSPTNSYPQQSLWKSIVLHLLPGALVTLGFIGLEPFLNSSGYPPLLAFLLAILLIDIPFMWGVMLYEGRRLNGRFSLGQVVLYRDKVSWKSFPVIFIGAFLAAFFLISLANPVAEILKVQVFFGLPQWMFLDKQSQYQIYARDVLIAIFTFQLILTGIVLPWTEELYFRGYLLPRITRYGKWTPLIGGVFFGLYHGWQIYGFVGVFFLGVVLGCVVWWKRDIRLSIRLHILANAFTRLMFLFAALTM